MNFMQAVEAMKEGKRVTRPKLRKHKGYFYYTGNKTDMIIFSHSEGYEFESPSYGLSDIEATDWEIVEEKKKERKIIFGMDIVTDTKIPEGTVCFGYESACGNIIIESIEHFNFEEKKKGEKYPMCESQDAQIDCRKSDCKYYATAGKCSSVSPAITLNKNKTYVCWSSKEEKKSLSDKVVSVPNAYHTPYFWADDVKEKLNELIDWLDISPNGGIIKKAKEIFGEELI